MADYMSTIKLFGTMDSYSTQIGELCYYLVKRFYGLTNKWKVAIQIGKHYRCFAVSGECKKKKPRKEAYFHHVAFNTSKYLDDMLPEQHHQMSDRRDHPQPITPFLQAGPCDPAKKDFLPKLKDHLLVRILDQDHKQNTDTDTMDMDFESQDATFIDEERSQINLINSCFFTVKTLRINYTTYDIRCN
ncbi:hypothetical protein Moror_7823 [Moniliophthora roreri MCA 2997]|uniref:Uncharacterized protein n=2 Tax=Moniliophthora roreri TaxID=221103 RepID=V2WTI0_MONRO|nr:hypothetical protein Moror_7823 [Moniliophthora roreri MCA 2997]